MDKSPEKEETAPEKEKSALEKEKSALKKTLITLLDRRKRLHAKGFDPKRPEIAEIDRMLDRGEIHSEADHFISDEWEENMNELDAIEIRLIDVRRVLWSLIQSTAKVPMMQPDDHHFDAMFLTPE